MLIECVSLVPGDQSDPESNVESEFTDEPPAAERRSAVHPGGATAHRHRGIRR